MKKAMKIYLPFALNQVKSLLAYRASVIFEILANMFGTFISYYLWLAIYSSSTSRSLGGLTQNEMVVYVFMVQITSALACISIAKGINSDIINGNIAMYLVKPMNYRTSLISRAIGTLMYRFLVPEVFIWIGLEWYRVQGLHMKPTSILTIVCYLVSCSLSFLIYVLLDFCFGMIAFSTTYMFGLNMAKGAIISFLSGQLIPISFFPETFQRVFALLPFSSTVYTPVMIYLGKYTGNTLILTLLRQVIWVILLYLLSEFFWNKVKRKINVLGG